MAPAAACNALYVALVEEPLGLRDALDGIDDHLTVTEDQLAQRRLTKELRDSERLIAEMRNAGIEVADA